jgi:hypothetical protein
MDFLRAMEQIGLDWIAIWAMITLDRTASITQPSQSIAASAKNIVTGEFFYWKIKLNCEEVTSSLHLLLSLVFYLLN